MSKINGIIFNRNIRTPWIKEQVNKDGKPQLNVGERYAKGKLAKIVGEKLMPEDKDMLYCDLVFDDGSVTRIGGMIINRLV